MEFAPVEGGLYAQGFAGDTLNTGWYLAHLVGDVEAGALFHARRRGRFFGPACSNFSAQAGIDASAISRDPERTLGLYLISLQGAERSFSYWRDQSAARRLADDPARLDAGSRRRVDPCLRHHPRDYRGERPPPSSCGAGKARAGGAFVSFDPNLRRRLWPDEADVARRR